MFGARLAVRRPKLTVVGQAAYGRNAMLYRTFNVRVLGAATALCARSFAMNGWALFSATQGFGNLQDHGAKDGSTGIT